MSKPREFWISTDSFMMKNQSGGDMLIAHTKINKMEHEPAKRWLMLANRRPNEPR